MYSLCAENQNCELTSERVRANTFSSAVKNLAKKNVYTTSGISGLLETGQIEQYGVIL